MNLLALTEGHHVCLLKNIFFTPIWTIYQFLIPQVPAEDEMLYS